MAENNHLPLKPLSPEYPMWCNEKMTTSSIVNTTTEKNSSQEICATAAGVNLVDCMQCYLTIPRCQIEEQDHHWKADAQKTLEQQIKERREEEGKSS